MFPGSGYSGQTDKSRSQPPREPESPEPSPRLKSVVKSVRISLPKPEDLEQSRPGRPKQV